MNASVIVLADFTREDDVDFSEHIFLEHHIADFPAVGPIRQFMDLVLYGLSCNPYITVTEKVEHIEFLRNYFQEKQTVLGELMGEEFCVFKERPEVDPAITEKPSTDFRRYLKEVVKGGTPRPPKQVQPKQ